MRYSITLGVFAVAMVLCMPGTARAWDGPPGTYWQTCKNIRVQGDDLYARCRNVDNRWVDTRLDGVYRCVGDIANVNGQLQCAKGSEGREGYPAGDYAQTCRDIRMRFNTLYARCQTREGYWTETSLDGYGRCTGPIANVDGQLRCSMGNDWDRNRYWRGAPEGTYRETCRDIRVVGDRLRARCETMGGYWRDTSLDDFNRCIGGVINYDGRLVCTRPGGRVVPRGSYTESCARIHVEGDTLRAMCQTGNGGWAWSQLNDWDDCRGGIWNENGQLRCRRDR